MFYNLFPVVEERAPDEKCFDILVDSLKQVKKNLNMALDVVEKNSLHILEISPFTNISHHQINIQIIVNSYLQFHEILPFPVYTEKL